MKRSGNRVCSSPAPSCSIGAAFVTARLSSSDTVIERPPSPPADLRDLFHKRIEILRMQPLLIDREGHESQERV